MSRVRQNFETAVEESINQQINLELYASYVYLSMAYYMEKDDVALPGLFKYFKHASDEEREHAQKLMHYQNKRGGNIILCDIKKPHRSDWGGAKEAMEEALMLERDVNENLLKIHSLAEEKGDAHFCDFLESEFLQEQVNSIKEISDHVTNLTRVGDGLGVYVFDKELEKND